MGEIDLTERIRRRAFEIWESEARPHGLAQVHWLRAESEICGGLKSPKSAKRPAKPICEPSAEERGLLAIAVKVLQESAAKKVSQGRG